MDQWYLVYLASIGAERMVWLFPFLPFGFTIWWSSWSSNVFTVLNRTRVCTETTLVVFVSLWSVCVHCPRCKKSFFLLLTPLLDLRIVNCVADYWLLHGPIWIALSLGIIVLVLICFWYRRWDILLTWARCTTAGFIKVCLASFYWCGIISTHHL